METYDVNNEVPKISSAFRRVKDDIGKIFNLIAENARKSRENEIKIIHLQKDLEILKAKLQSVEDIKCEQRYIIGNSDSKKFHYNNCPYAKNMKDDHKIFFDNIETAVKNGYEECSCIREV